MTNLYEKLKAPFPLEAYSVDSSRGFDLSSLKAQYVNDRLNEVFGLFGWSFSGEFENDAKGVLFHGILTIGEGEKTRKITNTGFSINKKNTGDTYKSARTDCLSKCSSMIGVGDAAFKGLVNPLDVAAANATSRKSGQKTTPQPASNNPGDFVINGGKFKGKALKDIDKKELQGYIDWMSKQDELSEPAKNLIATANKHLGN